MTQPRSQDFREAKGCMCGRCGYDLSGIVESWGAERACQDGAACPLEGVCSECGWKFAWRDVFNAWRLDMPWLIEHATGKRNAIRRIPRTAWRVALPWKFWGGLSMQARVRPWVAACVLLFVLAPVHLGVSGHETYSVLQNEIEGLKSWGLRRGFTPAPLDRTTAWRIVASVAGAPVVRPWVSVTQQIPRIRRGAPIPTGAAKPTIPTALVLGSHIRTIPWWAVSGTVMVLMWVVLLAMLPTTRAMTKLRWVHVARGAVYSAAAGIALLEVARVLTYDHQSGEYAMEWGVFMLFAVWLWVWWGCACTIGWQMRQGRLVVVLLGVASLLAGIVAGALFDPFMLSELM